MRKNSLNNVDLLNISNYITNLSLIKESPKIYISGPVSMYKDDQYALATFIETEHKIKDMFIGGKPFYVKNRPISVFTFLPIIVNPVLINLSLRGTKDMDWADFMVYDLMMLNQCDYIVMMDNWEKSEGAKIEREFAYKSNRIKEITLEQI